MYSGRSMSSSNFGQLVIGPPGSGKTTYCKDFSKLLEEEDRDVCLVNLDPGNENVNYAAEIDVSKLIKVSDVMQYHKLGPNGALMFCMEYLEKNISWLIDQLRCTTKNYVIFDCPGQMELYTHHKSLGAIFSKLQLFGYKLCTVLLVDSHYCSSPAKFISAILLSLTTMFQIGLPHINVLSKADLLKEHEAKLLFNIDFYTEVLDLNYLLEALDNSGFRKYSKLNKAIISVIESYNLVSFHLLDINDIQTLINLRNVIDKANGYVYRTGVNNLEALFNCAARSNT